MSKREEFAAAQETMLDRVAATLENDVEDALTDPENDFTAAVRPAIEREFLRLFVVAEQRNRTREKMALFPTPRAAFNAFWDTLRDTLAKTVPDGTQAQVKRIAGWLSTATVNGAQLSAGDQGSRKEWVSVRDDRVRDTHVAADGQTVAWEDPFTVCGVEVQYPGEPVGPIECWISCRCVAMFADEEVAVAASAVELADSPFPPAEDTAEQDCADEDRLPDGSCPPEEEPSDQEMADGLDGHAPGPMLWFGVLLVEGVETGDGRKFTPESVSWRDLPLPLSWQKTSADGHNGSVVVGKITDIRRDGPQILGDGEFVDSTEADEVIGLLAEGALRGVSVDVDMAEMAVEDAELGKITFDRGRISGATLVAIPAFDQAVISLGARPELVDSQDAPVVDSGEEFKETVEFAGPRGPGDKRGPGWVTHPGPTAKIHNYWTKGKGAAKIGWGAPGDFSRCKRQLGKYIGPRFLNRTCAEWHFDALGYWPATHAARDKGHAAEVETLSEGCGCSVNLTAAAGPVLDHRLFIDPMFTQPTPLQVVDGRHVFGHLALHDTCHIGMAGVCVTPPKSNREYAYFRTGAVLTDIGEIPVGQITLGTGHADLELNATGTKQHYDHTGAAVADVAVGEDEFGIWVSGAVRPGVTDEQIRTLQASSLSGDWRKIGNNLELVAALCVNVPGFPVPRTGLAASAGTQTALVAAGVVVGTHPLDVLDDENFLDRYADKVAARLELRSQRRARIVELQRTVNRDRVAGLVAAVEGGQ